MKTIIFLLSVITLQFASAQTWESTAWQLETSYDVFNSLNENVIMTTWSPNIHKLISITTDKEITWKRVQLDSLGKYDIAPQVFGKYLFVPYSLSDTMGCLVSSDFGKTWINEIKGINVKNKRVGFNKVGNVVFAFIYGSLDGGLLKSTDEGESWVNTTNSLDQAGFLGFYMSNKYAIVRTINTSYISSNFGETWEEINNLPADIDTIQFSGDRIYARRFNTAKHNFILFLSTDIGKTWIDITGNIPTGNSPRSLSMTDNAIFFENYFLDSKDYGLLISTDGGFSWKWKSFNFMDGFSYTTAFPIGNVIIYYDSKGISVSSDNGETWTESSTGVNEYEKFTSKITKSENALYTRIGLDIYRSLDTCRSWQLWHKHGGYDYINYIIDMTTDQNDLYIAPYGSVNSAKAAAYKSVDYGMTWTKINSPMTPDAAWTKYFFVGEGKMIAIGLEPYLTTDEGASWKKASQIWPNNPRFDYAVFLNGLVYTGNVVRGIKESNLESDIWIDRNNGLPNMDWYKLWDFREVDGYFYAKVEDAYFISSDKGLNWKKINQGMEPLARDSVCFDAKENEIYISNQTRLYYSSDFGATWFKRNISGQTKEFDYVTAIKIVDDKVIISLYNSGVFISSDKGVSWTELNDGFENDLNRINFLEITKDYLFCSKTYAIPTLNHDLVYLYRMRKSDLSAGEPVTQAPQAYSLYHNPTTDFLRIRNYTASAMEFTITNLLGNVVSSGTLDCGTIDVSTLPHGTYFLRIGDKAKAFVKI